MFFLTIDIKNSIWAQDILDIENIQKELIEFMKQKDQFYREMHQLIKNKEKDRQKILELVVENATDDIKMYGNLTHFADSDPDTLNDTFAENLKRVLFHILK